MSLQTKSINGVKIYNLATGRKYPRWISENRRKKLSKDDDYQHRVELLQDFDFPIASQRIKMSEDKNYIVATGTYPPMVKVFQLEEMSLKFERHLDSEVVDFTVLSDNFGKLAFLQSDRTISFHAPYGAHYSLRIPKFGRQLMYHYPTCDLFVSASGNEIYRINLQEGRFQIPLVSDINGINTIKIHHDYQLLAVGGEDKKLQFWDLRSNEIVSKLNISNNIFSNSFSNLGKGESNVEVTALEFNQSNLMFAVGTSNAYCLLYDLRSSKPLTVREHQYSLPIIDIKFHTSSRNVLSSDAKVIKIWSYDNIYSNSGGDDDNSNNKGKIFTNIETTSNIRDVLVVSDQRGESGMIMCAGEQQRIMAYYIPQLGPAPKWCSYLDSLTEELEENPSMSVYDDFKFITKEEVHKLGMDNLIGTDVLRGYMHGFFVNTKLYSKMKASFEPIAYDQWRKKRLKEKMEATQKSRIRGDLSLPQVNQELAQKLLAKKDNNGEAALKDNPLGDERFKMLFTSQDFQVDIKSEEFKKRNPFYSSKKKGDDDEEEEEEEEENAINGVDNRFMPVNNRFNTEDNDNDDNQQFQNAKKKKQNITNNKNGSKADGPKFYELNAGENDDEISSFFNPKQKTVTPEGTVLKNARNLSLSERIKELSKQEKLKAKSRKNLTKVKSSNSGGIIREMTYVSVPTGRKRKLSSENTDFKPPKKNMKPKKTLKSKKRK